MRPVSVSVCRATHGRSSRTHWDRSGTSQVFLSSFFKADRPQSFPSCREVDPFSTSFSARRFRLGPSNHRSSDRRLSLAERGAACSLGLFFFCSFLFLLLENGVALCSGIGLSLVVPQRWRDAAFTCSATLHLRSLLAGLEPKCLAFFPSFRDNQERFFF